MPGKREASPPPRKRHPVHRKGAGRKRRYGRFIPLILLIGVLFWIPTELFLSNNMPRLENASVFPKDLPSALDGLRILHLSDMHEKEFGKDNEILLRLTREANPDFIAITGDFIQSEEGLVYARKTLQALAAVAPVYYVTGNHEWSFDWTASRTGGERLTPRLKQIVEDCGAVWLDSEFTLFPFNGANLILAGLCDPNGPLYELDAGQLMSKIREDCGDDAFTLLLSHRYDMPEIYAGAGYDVVLAGHGHGGVVRLPFTDGLMGPDREWFPQGTSGVHAHGGTTLVVSRGLGDTYFPRFLNRPQVLLVTLRR